MSLISKLIILLVFAVTTGLGYGQDSGADRRPVTISDEHLLPLRVIVRPFSHIYESASTESRIVEENVSPFSIYYVYARPEAGAEDGWYEVGSDKRGTVSGWMQGSDLIEWKQTLCLTYAHPDHRKPVLMFKQQEAVENLLHAAAPDRETLVKRLYEVIDEGAIPGNFPVLSVEPRRAVDVKGNFYLLPILQHQAIEIGGREGRILEIAAATSAAQGRGASTLDKDDYRRTATLDTDFTSPELKNLEIELVFVMDLTRSMGPFVDATLAVMRSLSTQMGTNPDIRDHVRFGFVGFRDSEEIQGIEFNTRNFTPELELMDEFLKTLETVKATEVDSVDFEEDVFSGVNEAILGTQWSRDSLKFIVLIGDAPSHPLGHPWNASGKSERELRALADEKRISIFAMHLKDPAHEEYHATAGEQFRVLSKNRGTQEGEPAYYTVDSREVQAFVEGSRGLITTLARTVAYARAGGNLAQPPVPDATQTLTADETRSAELSGSMVRAALVDWLGRTDGAPPPRDITAWVADKDLLDTGTPAFTVNLLLTKNQLDSLATMLRTTLEAGARGSVSGRHFFEELQAISASAAVAPEDIRNARTLYDTGMVPDFLVALPYRSEIMDLNNELWASWPENRQEKFLRDLRARIEYYKSVHDNADLWVELSPNAGEDEKVAAIPLEFLP